VGSRPFLRIDGRLVETRFDVVAPADTERVAFAIMPKQRADEFLAVNEADFAYTVAGLGRFRVNVFRQRGSVGLVLRRVLPGIPSFEDLGLPPVVRRLAEEPRGLVLVTGPTGSGKTTTLAAMIDHINETQQRHIVTIEDPIEVLHADKRSIVNQREIGTDTKAYEVALKNALRQAPDCIMIGEIRDKQTMGMALAYAQSGHLALATLHANNSYHAMNRIISFYPLENRPTLLLDLSAALQAIISQRLVRTKTGGRRAAVEVLLNTRHISELIEKGDINEIKDAMEKSMAPGSQTFEQSLFKMFMEGLITQDECMANADSATNMLWLINQATAGELSSGQVPVQPGDKKDEKKDGPMTTVIGGASFSDFKIDASA
jgi:twitching motility protein PilU